MSITIGGCKRALILHHLERVKLMSFPKPDTLLTLRPAPPDCATKTLIACPGFETRIWRYERLAAHLTDWLPEFVFRPEDLPSEIVNTTALRKLMERAVGHLYEED